MKFSPRQLAALRFLGALGFEHHCSSIHAAIKMQLPGVKGVNGAVTVRSLVDKGLVARVLPNNWRITDRGLRVLAELEGKQ